MYQVRMWIIIPTGYSTITIEFPEEREKYCGWLQTVVGVGFLSGPLIGQTVYIILSKNYAGTFYFLAGFLFCAMLVAAWLLPRRINEYKVDSALEEKILTNSHRSTANSRSLGLGMHNMMADRSSAQIAQIARRSTQLGAKSKKIEKQITFKIFFTNTRAMTAIFSAMFAMIFMLFYEPFLADYLLKHYHVSDSIVGNNLKTIIVNIGYLFGIGLFGCIIGAPTCGYLCGFVQKRLLTSIAFVMVGVSMLIFGPSNILKIPE